MKKAFIITAVILAVSLCVSAGVVLFVCGYRSVRPTVRGPPAAAAVCFPLSASKLPWFKSGLCPILVLQ